MTNYTIPFLQINPRILPPPLLTSEPNSFAHNTLKYRVPKIVREVIADNDGEGRGALEELYTEITEGKIRELRERTEDREFWDASVREYVGRSWLDVPWYWAEAFFFRRVLEATRYFENGVDPYRLRKQPELAPNAAPRAVANLLANLPPEPRARFIALMNAALWGNRYDLSMNVAELVKHASDDERANLLVDDSARVWEFLSAQPRRIAYIADNAGMEFAMDLAFIDCLIADNLAAQIVLHLKPQPFFVSDAMPRDFDATLEAFRVYENTRALAERMRDYAREGRLQLTTHWFYPSSLFYFQLPDDLRVELAAMDFVILKGDANYRRLLGDARWDPTTPFDFATSYFPAPFVSLRTLKAELIVGLSREMVERLNREDREWLANGKRGVIQGKLKAES